MTLAQSITAEQQAVQTIAALLPDARQDINVIPVLAAREEVLAKFGAVFQPQNIGSLELRQYRDFLKFENNKHWPGFERQEYEAKDIEPLREHLSYLVDESEPLSERLNRAVQQVPGLRPAIATAILHIAYPSKYAPWNRTSEQALARLGLKPKFERDATAGEKYEAINATILALADALKLHPWDLDAIFRYFVTGPSQDEDTEGLEIKPSLTSILSDVLRLQKQSAERESIGVMQRRGRLIVRTAPGFMKEYINPLRFPSYRFQCKGSNGAGSNSRVPSVRIYSKSAAPTAASGCSLFYLFAADGSAVYLSLNQGAKDQIDRVGETRALLQEKGFSARELKTEIHLHDPKNQAGKTYEAGNIFAIEYQLPLPDEDILHEDLSDMLHGLDTIYLGKDAPASVIRRQEHKYEPAAPSAPGEVRETPPVYAIAPQIASSYTVDQCADETGIDKETIAQWLRAIERKGQAILYGPPGTGKTFAAQRLAKVLISETEGFIELVQFHPSYAYEDFVYGIRPTPGAAGTLNLEPVAGRFVNFCRRAQGVNGKCVLIIDEINRANLARVFGELMYLLEYRQETIDLALGVPFSIPENVVLIGTMNTADRSIAVVDHALRRRFAFCALTPNYETLRRFHAETDFPVDGLIRLLENINDAIEDPHYHLGISYFMRTDLASHLQDIWTTEIEPYLEEYFFDQPQVVTSYRWPQVQGQIIHG
ncbi:MAG: hypothetical protein JWQ02_3389 [Capsulimonas sp.]|nr:hypothetical protein [Capsulimonas sp.]